MDVIDRFNCLMVENGIDQDRANRISDSIRHEYAGERVYVNKRSEFVSNEIMRALKNGASLDDIIKCYKVSKITAYRMMRKAKGRKS